MAEDKTSWPDLVGKPKEEAEAKIKADRADVSVEFLEEGSMVSQDFKKNRVRVFFKSDGTVAQTPKAG
ncbi:hypothetical protein LSH36_14g12009 [Paralvinella palmiformis]|uniref:Uncharacterized protein n=1 Tax=Paralvinella palmiformis TaxID=53620 RepID=A0AAD9KCK8_9ANNE|nr:hypothetical protein LSH36_14g12009 [Paralvinella palmiformis]